MFKKGQRIHEFTSWDNAGTIRVRTLIVQSVQSFGAKVCKAAVESDLHSIATHLYPGNFGKTSSAVNGVWLLEDSVDVEAVAKEMALQVVAEQTARFDQRLSVAGTAENYKNVLRGKMSALHEPRVQQV